MRPGTIYHDENEASTLVSDKAITREILAPTLVDQKVRTREMLAITQASPTRVDDVSLTREIQLPTQIFTRRQVAATVNNTILTKTISDVEIAQGEVEQLFLKDFEGVQDLCMKAMLYAWYQDFSADPANPEKARGLVRLLYNEMKTRNPADRKILDRLRKKAVLWTL